MRVYSFKDVIGNHGTVSMIKSSIRTNTFRNFTLMCGDSGTGKSTCAEIAALSLNCENRVDENPCLHCESCRKNLASLQGKGTSTRVKKVNVAQFNGKKDIDNIITEIFKLDVGSGRAVFILEEVHSLDDKDQTALLEEIDKLDKNVYVILCTSRPRRLLEELRNRAIKFNFTSLKSSDSRILLEKLLAENNYAMGNNIKDLILRESRGVPRKIVNLLDFLKNNPCDYDTVLSFLGEINPRALAMLVKSSYDMGSYYSYLNELVQDYSIDNLIVALKKYFLDLHFLSLGVSTYYSNTSQEDKKLAESLGKEVIYKIQTIMHSMNNLVEEPDFMFNMLKIRSIIIKYSNDSDTDVVTVNNTSHSVVNSSFNTSTSFHSDEKYSVTDSAIEQHINSSEKRDIMRKQGDVKFSPIDKKKLGELLSNES